MNKEHKSQVLTEKTARSLNGKRVFISARRQIDWMDTIITGYYTIFVDNRDNKVWFFKTKRSRSGHIFSNLSDIVYYVK